MKLNLLGKLAKPCVRASAIALSLSASLQTFVSAPAISRELYEIIGLTSNNSLAMYGYNSRRADRTMTIKGVDGNVLGIDIRPANGLLYGITDTNKIYTINARNGVATLVSTLSASFNGGFQSGVDFNPVADRLRLVANNGQNFRINVDTGAVTVDTPLNYTPAQGLGSTGAAYTNSRAGATSTELYNIDYVADTLVDQAPPNDGRLSSAGSLGLNLPPVAGFDIVTDNSGGNFGFIVFGKSLYSVNISTGATKLMGSFREGNLIGVAVSLKSGR